MQCIENYVPDGKLKERARRATWLGNDESHYERVWTDHDIEDLKVLIKLTQNLIDDELTAAHYIAGMEDPKKKGYPG
jgi:hypothetical protein